MSCSLPYVTELAGDFLDEAFDEEDLLETRNASSNAPTRDVFDDAVRGSRRPARDYEELISAGDYDDGSKLCLEYSAGGSVVRRSASSCTRKPSFNARRSDTRSWVSIDGTSRSASTLVNGKNVSSMV